MSDIYCRCGEPWDLDCLHDWVAENFDESEWKPTGKYEQDRYEKLFDKARAEFRAKGCEMFGTSHSDCSPERGQVFAIADELMGDDVDGAISMMEDAEAIGLFND